MALIPIAPGPGICLSDTSYAVGKDLSYVASGASSYRQGQGRWADGMNMEFISGFPQKIAGWTAATSQAIRGIPRAIQQWRDNIGLTRVMIGTTQGLFMWQPGASTVPTDVTPLRSVIGGQLTNPFTVTIGNPTVQVADTAQVLQNGDWVLLQAQSPIGGVLINGWYSVQNRTAAGYQITSLAIPMSNAGPGGGFVNFLYPRETLNNPFQVTMGSNVVTVTDASNIAAVGAYVVFSGAASVGGVIMNGTFQIQSASVSTFTVLAPTVATFSATGGGMVSTVYEVAVPQQTTVQQAAVVWGQTGLVWGQANLPWGTNGFVGAVLPDGWTLDAYGSQMLAAPVGGTIYVYDPTYGGRAYPLLNAPPTMNAMFVTPERFVVALGINGALLEIAWADQDDYTDWTTTPTNTANTGRTFIGGSYFTGGIGVRDGVSLIFTNNTVFQLNYTGGQEIYSSPQIGDNCGLVGPGAVCQEGGVVFWMSDEDWWSWNGGVSVLPSDDVRDSVFRSNINRAQIGKCAVHLNRAKRQVRFFWPSSSAAENDSGMMYQYDQTCWGPLSFGRSCGEDSQLLATPITCDSTAIVFQEESGVDANGTPLPYSIQLGDSDLSNGDRNVDFFGVIPNFQSLTGNIYFTALASYYPQDVDQQDGPWQMTNTTERIDIRLDGKLFAFKMESNELGSSARFGVIRIDVQPSGARR